MLIGAMNHPAQDVLEEISWMVELGFDFVDLTIEPPSAASWRIDPAAIRRSLEANALAVVGHTAYYLPIASPFEEIRQAAVAELKRCLRCFQEIGAKWMNVHPDPHAPMHDRGYCISRNLRSLEDLVREAEPLGMGIMIENLPGGFNSAGQLGELLEPLPSLGLHLDIGHANLQAPRNMTDEILDAWGDRLRHVHLHDNKGGNADLHLPLGTGTVSLRGAVRSLQRWGFDGTITLEVFSPDQRYILASRDMLREAWDELARGNREAEQHRSDRA